MTREIRIEQERPVFIAEDGSAPPRLQPAVGPVRLVIARGIVGGELWLMDEDEEERLLDLLLMRSVTRSHR